MTEQKKRLLKAKIAVALQNELGRVPTEEEINNVFLLARVMDKAVLGLPYKWQDQKKSGQLAIFLTVEAILTLQPMVVEWGNRLRHRESERNNPWHQEVLSLRDQGYLPSRPGILDN
jgi:hypothetical protein